MPNYDRRTRIIETPTGPVKIEEKRWNEGKDDEHWACVQSLNPNFEEETLNGSVVGFFLQQYTVARELTQMGYTFHSQMDEQNILWVKYD